jgi:hypothetical protein
VKPAFKRVRPRPTRRFGERRAAKRHSQGANLGSDDLEPWCGRIAQSSAPSSLPVMDLLPNTISAQFAIQFAMAYTALAAVFIAQLFRKASRDRAMEEVQSVDGDS